MSALRPLALLTALGCGDPSTDAPVDTDVSRSLREVGVRFEGVLGSTPFSCRTSATGVGSTGLQVRPSDLRFYVHDVQSVLASGDAVAWDLDTVEGWQAEGAALIDLETGDSACDEGTAGSNDRITGTAMLPEGLDEAGLRFVVGLPFALSHAPLTGATGPLADADLFLSTTEGRQHFQANVRPSGGQVEWPVKIHATGCTVAPDGSPLSCVSENLVTIDLSPIDLVEGVVQVDLAGLLATSNLGTNASVTLPGGGVVESPLGCQSTLTDDDCAVVFEAYGLGSAVPNWWRTAP